MALRFHLFPQNTLHRSAERQSYPSRRSRTATSRIQCIRKEDKFAKMTDSELAKDLSNEIVKINSVSAQKQEAMKKSREILFSELCRYSDLGEDELKNKWRKIGEDEKWVFIKGFVDEWGGDFLPLSARSVKEMVEECLDDEKVTDSEPSSSFSSGLIPGLKRIIGFA